MNDEVREYLEEEVPELAEVLGRQVVPAMLAEAEPSDEDEIPVGGSKWCGRPDVPAGFAWPMTPDGPCWFLGQLSLADCQPFELGLELPDHGLLSFFYHDAGGPAGDQSRVFWFTEPELTRIEIVPDTRWGPESSIHALLAPRKFTFSQGYALPEEEHLELTDDERAVYDDLFDFILAFNDFGESTHQFFGLPRWLDARGDQLLASFGIQDGRIPSLIPESNVPSLTLSRLRVRYDCT